MARKEGKRSEGRGEEKKKRRKKRKKRGARWKTLKRTQEELRRKKGDCGKKKILLEHTRAEPSLLPPVASSTQLAPMDGRRASCLLATTVHPLAHPPLLPLTHYLPAVERLRMQKQGDLFFLLGSTHTSILRNFKRPSWPNAVNKHPQRTYPLDLDHSLKLRKKAGEGKKRK